MKKIISVLLATILSACGCCIMADSAYDAAKYPNKREDIFIRDPYVLVHDGKYYMYGTGASSHGYGCYVSEDLEHWSNSVTVFEIPAGFPSDGCFWAPECHEYNGSFYLFATYKSSVTGFRGVAIFKASDPLGPFEQISDGHATPKDRDCIDGTLFVDEDGQPWMIYVLEWNSSADEIGEMAASKMSDDLSCLIGEQTVLFRANDPMWTSGGVTDGPFIYRTKSNQLLMLWSNQSYKGYAVGIVRSTDGRPDGKWTHQQSALYIKNFRHKHDGGHAMLFTDLNGTLTMAIHSPNGSSKGFHETATFIPVDDIGCTIMLNESTNSFQNMLHNIAKLFTIIYYRIADFVLF